MRLTSFRRGLFGRWPLPALAMLIICSVAAADSRTAAPLPPMPYSLDATEVHTLRSTTLKRDYELYVSLPRSYGGQAAGARKTYPVVFVTDAAYAFPLIRSIGRRVNGHGGNMAEFILVGLGYAKGDDPTLSRNRDYTPTDIHARKTREADQGEGPYGQAEAYRRFVADDVLPFIARSYRADMSRKVYLGHSYGGLLGVHMLLTAPAMFEHYVLGSPSLWFDRRHMFDAERAYAAKNRELPAKVLMFAGAFESVRPGSRSPRFNPRVDMVKDVLMFEKQLKSRRYAGLTVGSEIIGDEDHLTVFPAIATRGLMWALPAR
jgi:uncharacterized protein